MRFEKSYQKRKKQKKFHRLSDHFSKKDFTCKCGECNNSLKISLGLIGALELLRYKARNRINIIKGYECPDSNEKAKFYKKNYHTLGLAADITINNMAIQEVFKLAEEIEEIKGLGINLKDKYVHIDTRKIPEKSSWVIALGTKIELTIENRNKYLGEENKISEKNY